MRSTMLPPWLRAESHEHRQLNTLPKCMRPEGDGAKRPTTGVALPLLVRPRRVLLCCVR